MTGWDPPNGARELAPAEVHLWLLALEADGGAPERIHQILEEEERARAGRYRFGKDRDRFVLCRGALRALLGLYLAVPPERVRLAVGAHGKPRLEDSGSGLQFNLSHSGDRALLAFTAGRPVGVDIERIDPARATADIADRFFSPEEIAALRRLPADSRSEAFFRCWTRKEAYLKARGDGFSAPLTSFAVSIEPGAPPRLLRSDLGAGEVARWQMREVEAVPGYAASLVAQGDEWEPRFFLCPPPLSVRV